MSVSPRRDCPYCGRSIAVVGGRWARHDPVDRGPELISCDGSLLHAPLWDVRAPDGTPSLFDLLDDDGQAVDVGAQQPALWE